MDSLSLRGADAARAERMATQSDAAEGKMWI